MTRKVTETQPQRAGLPCPDSSASFWHSQPSRFLFGHRTTEDLPSTADVVIVGSGITGASIAHFLANDAAFDGQSLLMLDAREICWGATGRNGGHCQPLLFDRTPEIAAFERKNVSVVKSLIATYNIDCEWRDVTGCRTFWDDELFEHAKRDIEALTNTDPALGRLVQVTNDQDSFREHRVRPGCSGMTLTQGAGQLWPYKYVTGLVEALVKSQKLNVQTNTPVLSIEGPTLHTPRGTVKAKQIILATNGYTSHLLDEFTTLIVPVRCEMSALHPTDHKRLPNSYGMVGYEGGNPCHDDYLVQRPFYGGRGGHLMFGGGRSHAKYDCIGQTDDDIVDPGEADYLRTALPKMLLIEGEELKASHQWTGIKGMSRDDNPWVGQVRQNVWLCGGYSGHGMPNATLCAKGIVDMINGCKPDIPRSYIITEERIEAAIRLPSVAVQDSLDFRTHHVATV